MGYSISKAPACSHTAVPESQLWARCRGKLRPLEISWNEQRGYANPPSTLFSSLHPYPHERVYICYRCTFASYIFLKYSETTVSERGIPESLWLLENISSSEFRRRRRLLVWNYCVVTLWVISRILFLGAALSADPTMTQGFIDGRWKPANIFMRQLGKNAIISVHRKARMKWGKKRNWRNLVYPST